MKILVHPSHLQSGCVKINGYKHSMVQVIAAAVALNQKTIIRNVPLVDDTFVLQKILQKMGCIYEINNNSIYIDPKNITKYQIDDELSQKIHGSMYLFAALVVQFQKVHFAQSGGCKIGDANQDGNRPFEQILDVLEKFGYRCVQNRSDYVFSYQKTSGRVIDISDYSDTAKRLDGPRVSSATKVAVLLGACVGKYRILNPYMNTDVRDLLKYLQVCGYETEVDKKSIMIEKRQTAPEVAELTLSDCGSEVISYITLAVMHGISLRLKVHQLKALKKSLRAEIKLFKKIGINLVYGDDFIDIEPVAQVKKVDFKVLNTTIRSDHQPFFALLLTKADGISSITECVWKNRFAYVAELNKLGFHITRHKNKIKIYPAVPTEQQCILCGCDTRSAAVLLIAALMCRADIKICEAEHLNRGYGDFVENLKNLGANLEIV